MSDLFQTIEPDPPIDVFQDSEAQARDYELREQEEVAAVREALTKGVSMKSIRVLCSGLGINFNRVAE